MFQWKQGVKVYLYAIIGLWFIEGGTGGIGRISKTDNSG